MTSLTSVSRNSERHRFEILTDDGRVAGFAEYRQRDGALELTHTVVEDEFEGQGVGGRLAREALDQIRADGLQVVPTCSFIGQWIDKHPEYADLVA